METMMASRLVRGRDVYGANGVTSLSRTTVWNLVRQGLFPAPVICSRGRKAFRLDEVEAWMRERPVVSAPGRDQQGQAGPND